MIERLQLKFDQHTVWLYPLMNMIFALILAYLVIRIDTQVPNIHQKTPDVFLTSVSLARTILGALVSSLLTITTFTFSTIMAVPPCTLPAFLRVSSKTSSKKKSPFGCLVCF